MKIASSALHMQAQHSATRVHAQSSRLQMWVGQRPASAASRPASTTDNAPPRLGAAPPAAYARPATPGGAARAEKAGNPDDFENLTPLMAMVSDLIERMTGVRAQNLHLPHAASAAPANTTPQDPSPANASTRPAGAGFGVEYEAHEVIEESETSTFAAQGVVRTADGQEIRFSLQLQMQRYYRQESHTSIRLGDAAQPVDPLVVNFDGTAAQLQDVRFAFDLDGDGSAEQVPLLAGNRGYLALDRNHNQHIDSGLELFGPATGNGYAELAAHDDDRNGWIDENDGIYQYLRIWTPQADGAGALRTLQEAQVGALALASAATPFALRTEANASLGAVRASSVYLREDGSVGHTQQIDVAV